MTETPDPAPPAGGPDADPFADPVSRVPGGYRTLCIVLGFAGAVSFLHLLRRGAWVRVGALLVVAVAARTLWARLRRPTGVGASFTFERTAATTLSCAALAGYGAVRSSPLLGVVAAALVFLLSWVTAPDGPASVR